ncbi:MAG: glycosyltransferase family 2 protein [Fuerstiella sp.]
MSDLTVSVAMCTFNGARFLPQQLESISAQTRLPDELVICDDCSTDSTRLILDRFASSAPFSVRVFLNWKQLGVAPNFEQAMHECQGSLILPADQDDVWHAEKLEQLTEPFRRSPEIGLTFCNMNVVDNSLKPLGYTQWNSVGLGRSMRRLVAAGKTMDLLLRYSVISGKAMAFRSSLRKYVLPVAPEWMHDEWIALIASAFSDVALVDRVLVDWRQHSTQLIGVRPYGILQQYRYARAQMGLLYFKKMERRTVHALDRVKQWQKDLTNDNSLRLLQASRDHAAARLSLRAENVQRLPGVAREVFQRNYWRFGYGWKSVCQDLFL